MTAYVELKAKSAYSLLEGALRVKDLPELAEAKGMPALGIADTDNLYGSLEISEALAGAGIQPIIGCALSLKLDEQNAPARRPHAKLWQPRARLGVYPKSEAGYLALVKLASKARVENDPAEPFITLEELKAAAGDLIVLTGGADGPVNRLIVEGQLGAAEALLDALSEIAPGRLYIELQRHGLPAEARAESSLIDWAYAKGLPLVATNEPHFASPDMYEAHDALLCVAGNTVVTETERRRLTKEHYFKSGAEMAALFADLPEAIEKTLEIARRIAFRPKKREPILPRFEVPEGISEDEALERLAREGLKRRLEAITPAAPESAYEERLAYELSVIRKIGFSGYFLIVADFIGWSRAQGIPVGPGRGSGAGSLVAYSLAITDLDPLKFNLLFERFLNLERKSMPDFDIDFCPVRRDEVFHYVRAKYGADRVAQIITFGKLQARAVLRDVGRVLAMPYGQVDRLCKLVPFNAAKPITLGEAVETEPRLKEEREKDEQVARLIDIALKLEGLYRHSSTHAAGIVIGDRPLADLIPVTKDPGHDMLVTQLDMKWVESAGLVKFDFLGLKTLTVLQRTAELVNRSGGEKIVLESLPLDDRKTFETLSRADVTGVFQLESSGMRDILRKLKPDRFSDIVALVALYRPGPMDDIPRYIACKQGTEKISYLHPKLEPILADTYGVIVYQDQALLTAVNLAGYSWGEVDKMRKAMGKKIKSEMDRQRARFISGAVENGIDKASAGNIFEAISKFAGYGFNQAHAAAYALIAYQTAYMKANHPIEFMAATMSLDLGNTDKLALLKRDAEEMGLKVAPPDINLSLADFSVSEGRILYGLAAVKNVGRQAMEEVVAERRRGGDFKDIFDFVSRVGAKAVNRRTIETLAKAGAFDSIHANRAELVAASELLAAHGARAGEERASKQTSLFGGGEAQDHPRLPQVPPWTIFERLQHEAEAVGFYLSGHPLDPYAAILKRNRVIPYAELKGDERRMSRRVSLAGTVIRRQERRSLKSEQPFAFVELTDPSGHFEAVIFSDLLRAHREELEPGKAVVLSADAEFEGEEVRLRVQSLKSLDALAAETAAGLRIHVDQPAPLASIAAQLKARGKGRVSFIVLGHNGREIEVELAERFQINPRIKSLLKAVPGVLEVEEV